MLGLPDEQAGQDQDEKHDDANDEPFHELIHLPKHRFENLLGVTVQATPQILKKVSYRPSFMISRGHYMATYHHALSW